MTLPRVVVLAVLALVAVVLAVAAVALVHSASEEPTREAGSAQSAESAQPTEVIRESVPADAAVATFAGGCFWCTEANFQETEGVAAAISGYAGGEEFQPDYQQVYSGQTGHRESIQVYYDPKIISYDELLDIYWQSIDPTDAGGQFVDRGRPYTTAIFVRSDAQRRAAERSKRALDGSGRFDAPIVTEILPFTTFYEAEEYHQDFYKKSADRYGSYEAASGRQQFKEQVWRDIEAGRS